MARSNALQVRCKVGPEYFVVNSQMDGRELFGGKPVKGNSLMAYEIRDADDPLGLLNFLPEIFLEIPDLLFRMSLGEASEGEIENRGDRMLCRYRERNKVRLEIEVKPARR